MLKFLLTMLNVVIMLWAVVQTYLIQVKRSNFVEQFLWLSPTPYKKTLALWLWWQACGSGALTLLMCTTPIVNSYTTNPLFLLLSWLPEAGFFLFQRLIRRHLANLESLPPSYWAGKPMPKHWQP
jgi:hypothetical protein